MEAFFDDGHEHMDGDGDPQLRLHSVLAGAEKGFDAQVLLDPLEEQFDLPAQLVELRNCQGGQREVVGQKDKVPFRGGVEVANAPKCFGVVSAGIEIAEDNGLVAVHPCGLVEGTRIAAAQVRRGLGACDKEGALAMDAIQAGTVQIGAIQRFSRNYEAAS